MPTSSTIKSTNVDPLASKSVLNNLDQINTVKDDVNRILNNQHDEVEHKALYYMMYNGLSGKYGIAPKRLYDLINSWKAPERKYDLRNCLDKLVLQEMAPLAREEKGKKVEKPESSIDYLTTVTGFNQKFLLYILDLSESEINNLISKNGNWNEDVVKNLRNNLIKKTELILNSDNVAKCNQLLNLLSVVFWYKQGMLPSPTEIKSSYQIEVVSSSAWTEPSDTRTPSPALKTFDFDKSNHELNGKPIQCFIDANYMEEVIRKIIREWDDIVKNNLSDNFLTSLDKLGLRYILEIENYYLPKGKKLNLDEADNLNQKVAWPIISYQLNPNSLTRISLKTKGIKSDILKGWEEQTKKQHRENQDAVKNLPTGYEEKNRSLIDKVASSWSRIMVVQVLNGNWVEKMIYYSNFLALEAPIWLLPKREKVSRVNENNMGDKIIKVITKSILSLIVSLLLEWVLFKILQQNYSTIVTSWIEFNTLERNRNIIVSFFLMSLLYYNLILPGQLNRKSKD